MSGWSSAQPARQLINSLTPFPGGVQDTPSFPLRPCPLRICIVPSASRALASVCPSAWSSASLLSLVPTVPTSGLFSSLSPSCFCYLSQKYHSLKSLPGQTPTHPSKPISSRKASLISWTSQVDLAHPCSHRPRGSSLSQEMSHQSVAVC